MQSSIIVWWTSIKWIFDKTSMDAVDFNVMGEREDEMASGKNAVVFCLLSHLMQFTQCPSRMLIQLTIFPIFN